MAKPVFCQNKSGGGARLLTNLRKLVESLERDEWTLEMIGSILSIMGKFNCTTALDQAMGNYVMQA